MSASLSPWIQQYLVEAAETVGASLSTLPWSPKKKKVQIIEFLTYGSNDPNEDSAIWARVSDKKHHIPVRFSVEAVAEYRRTRRTERLTEVKTAIINLKKFRLFHSRIPDKRPSRMTALPYLALECTEMTLIGSIGVSKMGKPVDIATHPDLNRYCLELRKDGGGANFMKLRAEERKKDDTEATRSNQVTTRSKIAQKRLPAEPVARAPVAGSSKTSSRRSDSGPKPRREQRVNTDANAAAAAFRREYERMFAGMDATEGVDRSLSDFAHLKEYSDSESFQSQPSPKLSAKRKDTHRIPEAEVSEDEMVKDLLYRSSPPSEVEDFLGQPPRSSPASVAISNWSRSRRASPARPQSSSHNVDTGNPSPPLRSPTPAQRRRPSSMLVRSPIIPQSTPSEIELPSFHFEHTQSDTKDVISPIKVISPLVLPPKIPPPPLWPGRERQWDTSSGEIVVPESSEVQPSAPTPAQRPRRSPSQPESSSSKRWMANTYSSSNPAARSSPITSSLPMAPDVRRNKLIGAATAPIIMAGPFNVRRKVPPPPQPVPPPLDSRTSPRVLVPNSDTSGTQSQSQHYGSRSQSQSQHNNPSSQSQHNDSSSQSQPHHSQPQSQSHHPQHSAEPQSPPHHDSRSQPHSQSQSHHSQNAAGPSQLPSRHSQPSGQQSQSVSQTQSDSQPVDLHEVPIPRSTNVDGDDSSTDSDDDHDSLFSALDSGSERHRSPAESRTSNTNPNEHLNGDDTSMAEASLEVHPGTFPKDEGSAPLDVPDPPNAAKVDEVPAKRLTPDNRAQGEHEPVVSSQSLNSQKPAGAAKRNAHPVSSTSKEGQIVHDAEAWSEPSFLRGKKTATRTDRPKRPRSRADHSSETSSAGIPHKVERPIQNSHPIAGPSGLQRPLNSSLSDARAPVAVAQPRSGVVTKPQSRSKSPNVSSAQQHAADPSKKRKRRSAEAQASKKLQKVDAAEHSAQRRRKIVAEPELGTEVDPGPAPPKLGSFGAGVDQIPSGKPFMSWTRLQEISLKTGRTRAAAVKATNLRQTLG